MKVIEIGLRMLFLIIALSGYKNEEEEPFEIEKETVKEITTKEKFIKTSKK
jgi:hypothetical protein